MYSFGVLFIYNVVRSTCFRLRHRVTFNFPVKCCLSVDRQTWMTDNAQVQHIRIKGATEVSDKVTERIVCFDYDGTLVRPKEGRQFPKDPDDWQWFSNNVPDKLRQLAKSGYRLIVFTHQSKPWKVAHITQSLSTLDVPLDVFIAWYKPGTHPPHGKPNKSFFDFAINTLTLECNPKETIFVGDAAGRAGDFSDMDRAFADGIGATFYTPEEYFGINTYYWNYGDALSLIDSSHTVPTVVLLCGPPGSGKSTFAKQANAAVQVLHGDDFKSNVPRMLRAVDTSRSVVLDATFGTFQKRNLVYEFAQKKEYKQVHVIQFEIDKSGAIALNSMRTQKVPAVAIHTFYKRFENPQKDVKTIIDCDFVLRIHVITVNKM